MTSTPSHHCHLDGYLYALFGPRVYPRGSLVIALVRGPSVGPWSVRWSVRKYLRDRSLIFSNFLHEVRGP